MFLSAAAGRATGGDRRPYLVRLANSADGKQQFRVVVSADVADTTLKVAKGGTTENVKVVDVAEAFQA